MAEPLKQLPVNAPLPDPASEIAATKKRTQNIVIASSISLAVLLGLIFYFVYKRSKK